MSGLIEIYFVIGAPVGAMVATLPIRHFVAIYMATQRCVLVNGFGQ